MSEVFVLEFQAANAAELYEKVSQHLGTNHHDGTGNWPAGLVTHVAGDKLVVVERWERLSIAQSDSTESPGRTSEKYRSPGKPGIL
jgi:hypothetical protein